MNFKFIYLLTVHWNLFLRPLSLVLFTTGDLTTLSLGFSSPSLIYLTVWYLLCGYRLITFLYTRSTYYFHTLNFKTKCLTIVTTVDIPLLSSIRVYDNHHHPSQKSKILPSDLNRYFKHRLRRDSGDD